MISTLIGNPAPPFDLPCTRFPDPSRTRVTLESYRGRWLLLLFYPRDFSLICPTELIGLSQRFEEFEQANVVASGTLKDRKGIGGYGREDRDLFVIGGRSSRGRRGHQSQRGQQYP